MSQDPAVPRLERPIQINAVPLPAPIERYRFRGLTLHLHPLMPPVVRDWLTEFFGHPAQDAVWEHGVRRLTPLGRSPFGGDTRIEPLGVLQLCLLATAPFRDCLEHHVRDIRYGPRHPQVQCRHWDLLLDTLAAALFTFLTAPHAWLLEGERQVAYAQAGLRWMEQVMMQVEALRQRRLIHPVVTATGKRQSLTAHCMSQASQVFAHAVAQIEQALGSDATLHAGLKPSALPERARLQLSTDLYEAWTQHGPPVQGRTWSKTTLTHTIAVMLKDLAIEHGDLDTIVDRIAYHLKPTTVAKDRRRRPRTRHASPRL